MGVFPFTDAVQADNADRVPQELKSAITEGTTRILTDIGFGVPSILPGKLEADIKSWNELAANIRLFMETDLDEKATRTDWSQIAVAVATCFARAPASLGPRLEAYELHDAFVDKAADYEYGQAAITFMEQQIETFSLSQSREHVQALEQQL